MTTQQRSAYAALRALGGFVIVSAGDGRIVKALKRRGLVRVRVINGVRCAVLRETVVRARRRRKMSRDIGLYIPMSSTGWIPEINPIR